MTTIRKDPDIMGGKPCLAGTRFPVAQVLRELAEGRSVDQLAADFDLDLDLLRDFMKELASMFERRCSLCHDGYAVQEGLCEKCYHARYEETPKYGDI